MELEIKIFVKVELYQDEKVEDAIESITESVHMGVVETFHLEGRECTEPRTSTLARTLIEYEREPPIETEDDDG